MNISAQSQTRIHITAPVPAKAMGSDSELIRLLRDNPLPMDYKQRELLGRQLQRRENPNRSVGAVVELTEGHEAHVDERAVTHHTAIILGKSRLNSPLRIKANVVIAGEVSITGSCGTVPKDMEISGYHIINTNRKGDIKEFMTALERPNAFKR